MAQFCDPQSHRTASLLTMSGSLAFTVVYLSHFYWSLNQCL